MATRQSAQHAIDEIKKAHATGLTHIVIIQEPVEQATNPQKTKAMTMISIIAKETGEQDVERMKWMMLNEQGWFAELLEELQRPIRLTDLSKEQISEFIDRLDQFMAEQGYIT